MLKRKSSIIWASLFLLLSFSLQGYAQVSSQDGDRIIGKWETKSKDHIAIYKEGDQYFGKPVLKPGQEIKFDTKNPDKELRGRERHRIINMKDFQYTKDNFWSEGTIYDPNNGKTYQCHITMNSNDEIKVRGFIGISLIGRSEIWKRVKD